MDGNPLLNETLKRVIEAPNATGAKIRLCRHSYKIINNPLNKIDHVCSRTTGHETHS